MAWSDRNQLPLISDRRFQIAAGFTQLGQLLQQIRVATVFAQQLLQLRPSRPEIARSLPRLSQADRHLTSLFFLTTITFESFDELFKLVDLFIQRHEFLSQIRLVLNGFRLIKRTPVNFNGFVRSQLIRQCCGQSHDQMGLIRIDPHRLAQRFQTFVRFT